MNQEGRRNLADHAGSNSFTYDAAGNILTNSAIGTYTFRRIQDGESRLVSTANASGTTSYA